MKLFIDDKRDIPDASWTLARDSQEAIDIIKIEGLPDVISFDHDLGGDDKATIVTKAITDMILDGKIEMPEDFMFFIHSSNPVGAKNIEMDMKSLYKHLHGSEYSHGVIQLQNGEQDYWIDIRDNTPKM